MEDHQFSEKQPAVVSAVNITDKVNLHDLKALFDSFKDFIIILEVDGKILYINNIVCERLCYQRTELLGKDFLMMFPEDKRKDASGNLNRIIKGMDSKCFIPFMKKNGDLVKVETISQKGQFQGKDVIIGISRDVTERIKAEEKLREQSMMLEKGLLQQIFLSEIAQELNSRENFNLRMDNTLRKIGVHASLSRVYVFEDNEDGLTTSRIFEWCNTRVSAQLENLQKVPYALLPTLKPILDKEGRMVAEDIHDLPEDLIDFFENQNIKAIVLYTLQVQGNNLGFVGFDECSGIRQWTHSELELLRTVSGIVSNAYERKLMEQSIREERDKAKQASVAKSEFLANMSHEIRTPMNAVLGFSEALYHKLDSESHKKMVKSIISSGNLLLSLLNDILDLSKIEANKMEINLRPTDFGVLLDEIEQLFREKATKKGLSLTILKSPYFPHLLNLDDIRIKQVIFNLVGNAVKFTDVGYIQVTSAFEPQDNGTGTLTIRVKDTGVGIPSDKKEKIFDVFSHYYSRERHDPGGTGLGLSISKRLVEKMKGSISVESEEGQGSTFMVTIPDVQLRGEQQEGVSSMEQFAGIRFESATLLIVDDVATNIEMIQSHLIDLGLKVVGAENGNKALDILKEGIPDLMLIDIRMPGMDGAELARILKNTPAYSHIPLIAFTANVPNAGQPEHSELFDYFLYKPVRRIELFFMLSRFLKSTKSPANPKSNLLQRQFVLLSQDVTVLNIFNFCSSEQYISLYIVKNELELIQFLRHNTADLTIVDLDLQEAKANEWLNLLKNPSYSSGQKILLTQMDQNQDVWPEAFDYYMIKPLSVLDVHELFTNRSILQLKKNAASVSGLERRIGMTFSAKAIKTKDKLAKTLESELLPAGESLKHFRSSNNMLKLCGDLDALGKEYEIDYLVFYSGLLLQASKSFQVDQTGYLLRMFPEIVNSVIAGLNQIV